MRTPCQDAPEAWVGDDWNLRQQAMRDCLGCPLFDKCDADAKANPPEHGVWAGVDYSKKGKRGAPSKGINRACAVCGKKFFKGSLSQKQWDRRKFCGYECAGMAVFHAARKRAAA